MLKLLTAATIALDLGACAQNQTLPISNQPVASAAQAVEQALPAPLQSTIATDLTDTQYNFTQAVAIGVLPASDPAKGCVDAVVTALTPPAPAPGAPANSFQPKVDGLASGASVAYILAQQAQAAKTSLSQSLPPQCVALIGKLVVDGAQLAGKGAINLSTGGVLGTINAALPIPLP
jgi:hypothetical protein